MAKRTLGNKFITGITRPVRKRKKSGGKRKAEAKKVNTASSRRTKGVDSESEEEAALLGIEDIDPDWEGTPDNDKASPKQTSKVQHPATSVALKRKVNSARTRAVTIKGSTKTKLLYQPKVKEKEAHSDIPEMVQITSVDGDGQKDLDLTINDKNKLEIATEINLEVEAKSSLQYVRWDLFKKQFESKVVDLWFWVRPGRGKNLVFLTKSGEKPYIATAINLRNLQGSTQNLPSLVAECINVSKDRDKGRYTVLESNGKVWTVKSLLAIKGGEQLDLTTDCSEDIEKKKDEKKELEKVKVKDDGSIKISLVEPVQKLPVGQSLITVVEGPTQRAMMQVKLPPTLPSQYWSLISVGQGQSSIQCPDSTLVLKCAILQQAATLSTATSTTVRIPIPVGDQDPSFGVYAVPGLKSHVFVGPFASNEVIKKVVEEDEDEIVCLEDGKEDIKDDDEIKILEPKKENEDSTKLAERKSKNELAHNTKMRGQIPVVLDTVENDDDIDIVGEVSYAKSQAKDLKRQTAKEVKEKPLSYYKLKPSEFGQIVMRQSKRKEPSSSNVEINYLKAGVLCTVSACIESSGKVVLTHPRYDDHDVISTDEKAAKAWLEEYYEDYDPVSCNADEIILDNPKPLPTEPPKVKTPPPVLRRIKTPSLPSGKSTSNISLFLQTKQQKDEAELFYELGHTAFNNFFQRNVSRAQILVKAKEEIIMLEDEGKKLELSKQLLLKKRSKLFEDFTKTLNGLPVARKKAAVIELKELLKRDKEEVKDKAAKQVNASDEDIVEIVEATPSQSVAAQHHYYPGQTPYTDITGIKTVRSDGSILRPMNAFMLWAKERRATMIAQGLSVSQVSQALSDQWRSLSEVDRSQYYKEAEHLKTLHRLQHPDYKYSPKTGRNTITARSPTSTIIGRQARSPAPVSPNQPGDQVELIHNVEPNQPASHPHIQVPKPLSQLRSQTLPKTQSLLLPRPKPSPRPTPALIPVQPQVTQPKAKQTHFEVLNIPTRPNIKISSTFTPRVPQLSISQIRRQSVEEVKYGTIVGSEKDTVEQLVRRQSVEHVEQDAGTLNMQDIPQDAADVLGLAVQSSGLKDQEQKNTSYDQQQWQEGEGLTKDQVEGSGHQKFVIQDGKIKQSSQRHEQQFIHIGGDNYQLVEQDNQQQPLVLNQEQAQQLLLAQQQGQQLLLEQEQLMMEQEGQQLLLDPSQHVFVDEQGRQVILRPDQQMMLQNQQMVQLEEGQQLMQLDQGEQMVQLEPGQQMVQLEGEDGQRVMVAYQEHGDLLFQAQGEQLGME